MTAELVCIGEVLVDIIDNKPHPGGAPLNVATLSKLMGVESAIISKLGTDDYGTLLQQTIDKINVTNCVAVTANHKTGYATVKLDESKTPRFELAEDAAYDHLSFNEEGKSMLKGASFIYIGTLAQRYEESRKTIQQAIRNLDATIFYDANFREGIKEQNKIFAQILPYTSILKISDEESHQLAKAYNVGWKRLPERLLEQSEKLHTIFITKGSEGAEVHTRDSKHEFLNTPTITVVDTTGCGDAFCAGVIKALQEDEGIKEQLKQGVIAAAAVAQFKGAIPQKEQFNETLQQLSDNFLNEE